MSKKQTLSFDYDYNYQIIGICCHLKDYRLAYFLNKDLTLKLIKQEDFTFSFVDTLKSAFTFYKHNLEENELNIYLMQNRSSEGGVLIPEYKQADYIFIIENEENFNEETLEYLTKIKNINAVLTAFNIDYKSLKHKDILIFE